MDDKEIKQAIDDFEEDDFVSAKEKLSKEIQQSRDEYLKNKLGLENDIDQAEKDKESEEEDEEEEDDNIDDQKKVKGKPKRK